MSGAPSGSATPFQGTSRRGSHENIQALTGMSDYPNGEINSALLQSRLASLQRHGLSQIGQNTTNHSPSGGSTPHNGEQDSNLRPTPPQLSTSGQMSADRPLSNLHHSRSHSGSHQRQTGVEEGQSGNEVHRDDYDMGVLSRVPSYGAALRTSEPSTPYAPGPPSYNDATSRPPSPHGPRMPSSAYFRDRAAQADATSASGTSGINSAVSGVGSLRLGSIPDEAEQSRVARSRSTVMEDEARLRTLRAHRNL